MLLGQYDDHDPRSRSQSSITITILDHDLGEPRVTTIHLKPILDQLRIAPHGSKSVRVQSKTDIKAALKHSLQKLSTIRRMGWAGTGGSWGRGRKGPGDLIMLLNLGASSFSMVVGECEASRSR